MPVRHHLMDHNQKWLQLFQSSVIEHTRQLQDWLET
nr:MAG TPA: hypothetical protein [Caudoviricetes sp.]